jgi:hypothetical protein
MVDGKRNVQIAFNEEVKRVQSVEHTVNSLTDSDQGSKVLTATPIIYTILKNTAIAKIISTSITTESSEDIRGVKIVNSSKTSVPDVLFMQTSEFVAPVQGSNSSSINMAYIALCT